MEEKKRKIDYAKFLRNREESAYSDKATFTKYHRNKITLKECFVEFMANNKKMLDWKFYDEEQFGSWLKSIGY